ncbi:acyl-CoA ligase (AMP-forming), exosortase A system-associated [Qipengyuania atrilutea]|uniref:Acyl-CoA ligase (AMP-forming), exosortase A system-associated n=1 Tax=Qipengyuania atrilutea TaxID=2744473 RepID=A0A850H1W8_9SPHN|nr:acyl-CoA ligase (AMP-forming), exosortase A system-associated [Actirhodobacter atriluteus]NVD43918.1 acyl-CoA ligase (AMP-forming), exosortase A system-associated [Actirhodobacter atriluteus]
MTDLPHQTLDPVPRPLDHICEFGRADDPALAVKTGTLTYGELRTRIATMAGWLAERYTPGTRVASWAAKGELTCVLPLAAARAGLVHVPINPLLKRAQVAHILSDSGAALLVATNSRRSSLNAIDVPAGCTVMDEGEAIACAAEAGARLPISKHDPDDLAAILYTSGSTGRPKGVMLSHANMWLGAVSVAHYLSMDRDDRTLAVLPLSFDYGQSQLFCTWIAGGCVYPLDYLFPQDVTKACARHQITTLAGVPPLWRQLVAVDWTEKASQSLRRITNSGGALTRELVSELRQKLPKTRIYPMYGLTEAFRSTFLDPAKVAEKPTSMGQAIPFAEILVVANDGKAAGTGQEGELVHCGPLVAKGYWQDAERTAARFKSAPEWSEYGGTAVYSGDTVLRDADGDLHFMGRDDAMIKSAGNRISPQEIEEAALATGVVSDAAAFGMVDPDLGQAVHLAVVGNQSDEERLRRELSRELPNFMMPAQYHWYARFPVNANGKLDRTALEQEKLAARTPE